MDELEKLRLELAINHMRGIASNYEEFVDRILRCIQAALNTDEGQEFIDPLLADAIANHLTPEERQQKKADLMVVLFFLFVGDLRPLKHELAHHLYNELRKES